ncbi:MAG: hypothetical protein M1818_002110 [Claussenomyces sp. TS43310]|nr:MAG: hypothetical protein M1818_002110 [Claussenomyces sp. TS43310]
MSRYSPTSQPSAGLMDVLNHPPEQRDSAYFSSTGDASKRECQWFREEHLGLGTNANRIVLPDTSLVSNNPAQYSHTPSSSGYTSTTDKTPSPITTSPAQPIVTPTTTSGMTVASMVSPTTSSSVDQSMLAKLDRASGDASQRASMISQNGDGLTRRESIESRSINAGFEGMKLANSPYASHNQSASSIQVNLQRERNPANGPDRLSASRFPSSHTIPFASDTHKRSRIAPAITGPADSSVAHGAVPTQGQAWAFPADVDHRVPSAGRSNEAESRQNSYLGSRRSSIADSVASSQYTTESRMPAGQRRLEEGYSMDFQNRLSGTSTEFQGPSHHHHSLQHKQIGDLRDEDGDSPGAGQPYSRTPELRVSHKLAERKRRNEMKELYDRLRSLLPQDRASKASKWEILSKAIAEHKNQSEMIKRQSDEINGLKDAYQRAQQELRASRQESNELLVENRQLRSGVPAHSAPGHMVHGNMPPTPMEAYPTDVYARGIPLRGDHRAELPPLRTLNAPMHGGTEMSGVQYHHDPPPANTFRQQAYPSGM